MYIYIFKIIQEHAARCKEMPSIPRNRSIKERHWHVQNRKLTSARNEIQDCISKNPPCVIL